MFPVLLTLIFLGVPIAFALMSTAFAFGLIRFGENAFFVFMHKIDDITGASILAAVPLFVFMGAMLEKSGTAERLFEAIHLWTQRLPGGLAVGTIAMCVIFAACSGVIGATETVVGLLATPVMLKHGYDKALISGTITAGGSLGAIIPPSVVVIILAAVSEMSLGDMFIGMFIPGLLMAFLYVIYIILRCSFDPMAGPKIPHPDNDLALSVKLKMTGTALFPPLALIVVVLGSIMIGVAVPTEAAAVGAIGTIVMTIFYGRFNLGVMIDAMVKTLSVTAMILTIVVGGTMFASVFLSSGGFDAVRSVLEFWDLGRWGTLILILALVFLAGFVLDGLSIILIIVPIGFPIIQAFGFDPIWFAVLFLVVKQTSYLTPPMAGAIFYFRAIAPPQITLGHMYKGVIPFIVLDLVVLALVMIFPDLALWLPKKILG
ncbi:MAG: C4-dicarboxylate ABC transporter permease [Rhodospirillaceae bacterium]|nr:C4-dicarboxylate ABC transporter permease [Rhodospirillaceae bacterium]